MTEQEFLSLMRRHEQTHIIEHFSGLSAHERTAFLGGLENVDIDYAMELHKEFRDGCGSKDSVHSLEPAAVIAIPRTSPEIEFLERARKTGEALLRDNKVAVLIVAGGQGSRLGHEGSKGTFPISPLRNKTLFQLFSEQVGAIRQRYSCNLPLLIMTSRENHEETVGFFRSNGYFGLESDSVHFFPQGMLPTVTPEGMLLLGDRTSMFTNPDGHGGSLKSLHDSGILQEIIDSGIKHLFYCQVDNPLVKIADPVFLGYHSLRNAECSTKVVRRRDTAEKVGVYVLRDGRDAIVEYSEIGEESMTALDEKGEILYWAGNTAIHIFDLLFIKRLNERRYALPYHCAEKDVDTIDLSGNAVTVRAWKFETFVFDAIPFAHTACAVEVDRREEFSPVKNREGSDSPETAVRDMCELHRNWLAAAGAETSPDSMIEVSPLFALDRESFITKFKTRIMGSRIVLKGRIYLG